MITLWIIISLLIIICGKIVYDSQKKYNWFKNLKLNDKILVDIFSENCNCKKESIVTAKPIGKFVKCEMLPETLINCEKCANLNSLNDKNELTCWYKITIFNKNNIYKI